MVASHDFGARVGKTRDLFHPVMLHPDFAAIADATEADAIQAAVEDFVSAIGFDRYAVVVMEDDFSSADSGNATHWIDNTPPDFRDQWDEASLKKRDPVLNHCKTSVEPFTYGPEAYSRSGLSSKWEAQAARGFAYGVAVAFHLPRNQHVLFGIDRYDPLPKRGSELTALVAHTHLFATFVQSAALGVFLKPACDQGPSRRPHLARREQECLQWAAEGKTAWETGMILSIAEGSVAKVLASAIRKLECATKSQAVVKALRLGLIH